MVSIIAHNFSSTNIWAYYATINGVALSTPFVNHSQLVPPAFRMDYGPGVEDHGHGVAAGLGPSLLEFWLTDEERPWGPY